MPMSAPKNMAGKETVDSSMLRAGMLGASKCWRLPTLHRRPYGLRRMARGRYGSLFFIASDLHRPLVAGLPAHCERCWTLPAGSEPQLSTAGREIRNELFLPSTEGAGRVMLLDKAWSRPPRPLPRLQTNLSLPSRWQRPPTTAWICFRAVVRSV